MRFDYIDSFSVKVIVSISVYLYIPREHVKHIIAPVGRFQHHPSSSHGSFTAVAWIPGQL